MIWRISIFNVEYKFKISRPKYLFLWGLFLTIKWVQKGVYRTGEFFLLWNTIEIVSDAPIIHYYHTLECLKWSIFPGKKLTKTASLRRRVTKYKVCVVHKVCDFLKANIISFSTIYIAFNAPHLIPLWSQSHGKRFSGYRCINVFLASDTWLNIKKQ